MKSKVTRAGGAAAIENTRNPGGKSALQGHPKHKNRRRRESRSSRSSVDRSKKYRLRKIKEKEDKRAEESKNRDENGKGEEGGTGNRVKKQQSPKGKRKERNPWEDKSARRDQR